MTSQEARGVIDDLQAQAGAVNDIAKVAKKHGKSLSGRNPYGERFHAAVVALTRAENKLGPILITAGLHGDVSGNVTTLLSTLKSPRAEPTQRSEALKALRLACQATVLPTLERMTANPVPDTEQVLPLDVVRPTRRKYLERIVLQANGCYEHGWFDACSVMVRRLVETLIIELYEAKGRAPEIKNGAGDFLMLSGLIEVVLEDKAWNLGRELKKALPDIKLLGDRSAHTRHYSATKHDVDKVLPGVRVVVEQFLHLAELV